MPPGCDWRKWYFDKLERAAVFVMIWSPYYIESEPCYEEAHRAHSKGMPVVICSFDPHAEA